MQGKATEVGTSLIVERGDLQRLIDALLEKGYRVIGPIVRDGAIIYDEMTSVANLPEGWTDEQDGGKYRLKRRNDDALFGFNVGPHSWKKFLHPPDVRLLQVTRDGRTCASPRRTIPRRSSLSSAPARAICTRSPFKTRSSSTGHTLIRSIRRGASKHSSSRSTAERPAARASASR